jgi:hypothetical protein
MVKMSAAQAEKGKPMEADQTKDWEERKADGYPNTD